MRNAPDPDALAFLLGEINAAKMTPRLLVVQVEFNELVEMISGALRRGEAAGEARERRRQASLGPGLFDDATAGTAAAPGTFGTSGTAGTPRFEGIDIRPPDAPDAPGAENAPES